MESSEVGPEIELGAERVKGSADDDGREAQQGGAGGDGVGVVWALGHR